MRLFFENRRGITFLAGAILFGMGVYALWAGEQTEEAKDEPAATETAKDERFPVPKTDDPTKLIEFIEEVRDARPPEATGPDEHRALELYKRSAPQAIATAAEKVLTLTAGKDDKKSEYADASIYLLETKISGFKDAEPKERTEILNQVVQHLKKYGVRRDEASVAYGISQATERFDEKAAGKAYEEFAKVIAEADDEEIRDLAVLFAGPARRINLVGSKMDVFGKTLDGEEIDWESYRGKVVLVDFWATWCGPCVAELPNVKEAYEKFHDKGFEVVGVSLDQRRAALDSFLEKTPLPWTQLHMEDERNALAEHYGVNAIPFVILVDKEGKVISTDVRGRKLHDQLDKIFAGSSESGE